jgi:hypothetical protein
MCVKKSADSSFLIQPLISEDEMVSDAGENGSKTNLFDGRTGTDGSRSLRVKSLMNKSNRYVKLARILFSPLTSARRDALLRWCKGELEPYGINPTNLTKSFQSPSTLAALGM